MSPRCSVQHKTAAPQRFRIVAGDGVTESTTLQPLLSGCARLPSGRVVATPELICQSVPSHRGGEGFAFLSPVGPGSPSKCCSGSSGNPSCSVSATLAGRRFLPLVRDPSWALIDLLGSWGRLPSWKFDD